MSAACVDDMVEPRYCSSSSVETAVPAECHAPVSDAETRVPVATSVISQSSDISESGMRLSTIQCSVVIEIFYYNPSQ